MVMNPMPFQMGALNQCLRMVPLLTAKMHMPSIRTTPRRPPQHILRGPSDPAKTTRTLIS